MKWYVVCLVVVCGVSCGGLWWFVEVCGGLWCLVPPMLSDGWLSRYGLLENYTTEKAIFEGALDFNLQPHPWPEPRSQMPNGMKANPTGYLWSKYKCFLMSGCQDSRKLERK